MSRSDRPRRSAKAEIKFLINRIMLERPLNNTRVVIELMLLEHLCAQMGWITMKKEIIRFLSTLDPIVVNDAMTSGLWSSEAWKKRIPKFEGETKIPYFKPSGDES